jgi:hypothetical protein
MRELLGTFINALLSAQADSVCGAEYGTRSADRVNSRNGYRRRDLDTRAGTLDIAIPKLREGTFFPDWLLERHRRAEAALTTVVATCYLLGVSTRRMDKLVKTLGITGLSKEPAPPRSGMVCGFGSTIVVTGRHGRGLIPRIPLGRMSFAVVMTEMTSPAARRSAVIRGAPLTPSEAAWAASILSTSSSRRASRGPGPAARRSSQA